ncbi:hypothetical protein Q5384_14510 [Enterobacter ludwigii]|uniref:hypothetical protein n=1 Tax=Enterobacter ludwigii TaxID=299767 RepID=UPI002B4BE9D4|nr:hypothetical protein [Enterobacter ludwigii]WRM03044.1 hypothetical protein Q5384_14510 [Enterobacter ludwigii]
MSNIDKQAVQAIADLKSGYTLGHADVAILNELACIALASLEAEQVAYIRDGFRTDGVHFCGGIITAEEHERTKPALSDRYNWKHQPLYTAPPAPVVPDDVMAAIQKVARIRLDLNDFDGDKRGILDCLSEAEEALIEVVNRRAAMLQGADGNSPVTQDGSEDTKRLDWLDAQNKRLNEYYGTTYGWKFDANFQRNAMMLNDSNYPVMTVRQAIDEAIAAAPQQEVKP